MKKKLLTSAIALTLALGSTNALTKEIYNEVSVKNDKVEHTTRAAFTAAAIGQLILDKAKSKFVNKVSSLLIDSIFGSSGPQFVNLSEESLREIQNRVRQELVRTAEYEFLADFNSMEDTLAHFSDSASNNYVDQMLLTTLVVKANDVMNHHALNPNFNSDYYYMADGYALAATVAMSIYTERHIIGAISSASVSSKGDQYASKLTTMINNKKSAMWPLRDDCEMTSSPYDQYVEWGCDLKDPFGNYIASATLDDDYRDFQEWDEEVEAAKAAYYKKHFGDLEDIATDLRNF